MKNILVLFCLLLLLPVGANAAAGVKGRVAWRGELIPGVIVRAYSSIDAIAQDESIAQSQPTAQDGTYTLALKPGKYYFTARSSAGTPEPGDFFCYYSGAPIIVQTKGFRQVGFNLVKVPQEEPAKESKRSGVWGEISFQGEPLERTYLYVYKSTGADFKGPAWFIQPVAKGRFRMSLPPGDYWLLARKRAKGGQYGPIEIGDYFNYYYGNPVHIEKNKSLNIHLETITRLSMLEEDPSLEFVGINGQIFGPDSKPASGLRVFAYRSEKMSGTPAYISSPSGEDGHFQLSIPDIGAYWLLARQMIGGPAGSGELYGKMKSGIELTTQQPSREVRIDVSPHP